MSTILVSLIFSLTMSVVPTTVSTPAESVWTLPERSGLHIPANHFEMGLGFGGAYISPRWNLTRDEISLYQFQLSWNVRLHKKLALFGWHDIGKVSKGNIAVTLAGNEFGLRYRPLDILSLETAFLVHRSEHQYIDGHDFAVGGVKDYGWELGGWVRVFKLKYFSVDDHLYARAMHAYNAWQFIGGEGLRLTFYIGKYIKIRLHGEIMGSHGQQNYSSYATKWNKMLEGELLGRINNHLTLVLSAKAYDNLLVGERPMLELANYFVDKPYGYVALTFAWSI